VAGSGVLSFSGISVLVAKKFRIGLIKVKPDLADFAANCAFLVLSS
jgi:hypothetical protein